MDLSSHWLQPSIVDIEYHNHKHKMNYLLVNHTQTCNSFIKCYIHMYLICQVDDVLRISIIPDFSTSPNVSLFPLSLFLCFEVWFFFPVWFSHSVNTKALNALIFETNVTSCNTQLSLFSFHPVVTLDCLLRENSLELVHISNNEGILLFPVI